MNEDDLLEQLKQCESISTLEEEIARRKEELSALQ